MDDRPYLDCPDCGEPLFPASGGARCTVEVDEDRAYAHLVAVEVPDEAEP